MTCHSGLFNRLSSLPYWGFYPKSPQPAKRTLVSPVEPASRTSLAEPAWRLRFIGGFKFICSARIMGNIFTAQIWIIYINIVACKMCVITRIRSWMGSMFQNLDLWLPNIFPGLAKNKGKIYGTKIYHYLLITRLACDQLGAYFLCHNHVPVFYHQSSFTLERSNIFLNLGLSNPLETVKNFNIQFVVPLPWNIITIIFKLFCH